MATIKDIADRLGVSVSTVSKGLNGAKDISESVRQQVLDTAVEMGYKSKRRSKDHKKKLCLFIENMDFESVNQFGYEIILGFKQAAFKERYDITVLPVSSEFQKNESYDTYCLFHYYFLQEIAAGEFVSFPKRKLFVSCTILHISHSNKPSWRSRTMSLLQMPVRSGSRSRTSPRTRRYRRPDCRHPRCTS